MVELTVAHPEPEQEQEPDSELVRQLRGEVTHLQTELDVHMADRAQLQGALDDRIADYQQLLKRYRDFQVDHGPQAALQSAQTAVKSPIHMDHGDFRHLNFYCGRSFSDRSTRSNGADAAVQTWARATTAPELVA